MIRIHFQNLIGGGAHPIRAFGALRAHVKGIHLVAQIPAGAKNNRPE